MSAAGPGLKRSLGLWETTLGGVGVILGAGIYALVGAIAADAGSAAWLSFAMGGVVAVVLGLCYAELASMYPLASADYEYANRAIGARPAFLVGWLISIGNIIAAAAVAVAMAGYTREFLDVDARAIALVALLAASAISIIGIKESIRVVVALSFIEIGGLVFIIAIGVPSLGDVDYFDFGGGYGGIVAGASLTLFAYNGFSQIAMLSEEARDASRVVPRAILLAIAITAVLYILVAASAVAVVGANALGVSDRPLAEVASEVLGSNAAGVIAVIAIFSSANSMLLHLVVGSRMIYGMAADGALPTVLARVHPRLRTPIPAILVSCAIAIGFALIGKLAFIAGTTSFTIFAGFFSVCVALIVLRIKAPHLARPFRAPLNIKGVSVLPVVGILFSVVLMAGLATGVLLLGAGLVAVGLLVMLVVAGRSRAASVVAD
jgi:basic amino acid/polyamine antiporter, APA family